MWRVWLSKGCLLDSFLGAESLRVGWSRRESVWFDIGYRGVISVHLYSEGLSSNLKD